MLVRLLPNVMLVMLVQLETALNPMLLTLLPMVTLPLIVPVPPRPFPAELRDPDLRPAPWTPADYATLVWGALSIVGLPWLMWRGWRRWRRRR